MRLEQSALATPSASPSLPLPAKTYLPSPARPLGRAARLGLYLLPLALLFALGLPTCPYALLLHHPCPGCGLTRATLALLAGDLDGALALNPLSPLVCPVGVGTTAYGMASYVWRGRVGLESKAVTILGTALCLALIAVWFARWFGAFGGHVPV